MRIDQLLSKEIGRRDFLVKSGKAAAWAGAVATGINSPVGCAPTLKESRQDVNNVEWECNPVIPITDKIYTGTNLQVPIDHLLDWWRKNFGISLTFHHPSLSGGSDGTNDMFRKKECETQIRHGVIPVIRYTAIYDPKDLFKPIVKGKLDDDIKKFAYQAAKFEHPLIIIPFEQTNSVERVHKLWCCYPGSEYVDAWVHMHELFEKEGANKNTAWSTKLNCGSWPHFSFADPFQYIPPKQYLDIIGWLADNINIPEVGLHSQSLKSLFDSNYKKAARIYPTKPQMFWEFSSNSGSWQHKWLDKSLTDIEERYLWIKGIMLDEMRWTHPTNRSFGTYNPGLTPKSLEVIRKHFASGKYDGSIIKK